MLAIPALPADQPEKIAQIVHRDGFACVAGALTAEQLATARRGADRVIAEQMAAVKPEAANRGLSRYSFGQQIQHPEWQMLIDLPTILPILDAYWASQDYRCMGGGGDYSAPGAQMQGLHSDMGEQIHDPTGATSIFDLPAPFIVVNFLLVDFTRENGATRFVPCTQRSRLRPPNLADEPEWMRESIITAPAGSALVRDVRCWHGGTPNSSAIIRPMVSTGYYAPWYGGPSRYEELIAKADWERLSPRGQDLTRHLRSRD